VAGTKSLYDSKISLPQNRILMFYAHQQQAEVVKVM